MHGHVRTESNQVNLSAQPVLNHRIVAIVNQAHSYAYSKNPEEDSYGRTQNQAKYDIDYNNKFAELIVRECANFIHTDCGNYTDAEKLVKHFRNRYK